MHSSSLESVSHLVAARSSTSSRTSLDGHGIFTVIVFACVALIVIRPLAITLPQALSAWVARKWKLFLGQQPEVDGSPQASPGQRQNAPRRRLYVNHVTAPIIGIILLLATKCIGGQQIRDGIVGKEGVEPYSVLALFIGLAYIAISLDATGLLRYLALQVSLKGGQSGSLLFNLLYGFFFFLGLGVGNDPVILSGTAFLLHFTRVAGISKPDAWIWAQFAAANVSSALLVSSNPTNIVIAEGFDITFPSYSAFMALPTAASGITAWLLIRLMFVDRQRHTSGDGIKGALARLRQWAGMGGPAAQKNQSLSTTGQLSLPESEQLPRKVVFIPSHLIAPDVRPRDALVDPIGAIYGSLVMTATLAVLIGTSVAGGVKVYQVALPGAALCLLRDLGKDLFERRKEVQQQTKESNEAGSSNAVELAACAAPNADHSEHPGPNKHTGSRQDESTRIGSPSKRRNVLQHLVAISSKLTNAIPTVTHVLTHLPVALLPFAFGMFILVESLDHVGFINIMASGLGKVCASGGTIGTAYFIGFLSVILCNLGGTNIGSCILLVRAINSDYFTVSLPTDTSTSIVSTATFSIALGSNVGALGGTFAASLAGLLWRDVLRKGGLQVRPLSFALWSFVTAPLCLTVGLAVVWAQVRSGKWPI